MHHVSASVTVMMFIPICNIDHESNDCESVGVTSVEDSSTRSDPATLTSIIQNSINSTKDPFDIDPINLQNTVDPNDPIDLNIQKYGRCRSCTTTS
eukprot:XP_011667618.1 PREDICTED: uncharacterized protein LOC105439840 isoform X2 [Strongylocentrotus purpuratus]